MGVENSGTFKAKLQGTFKSKQTKATLGWSYTGDWEVQSRWYGTKFVSLGSQAKKLRKSWAGVSKSFKGTGLSETSIKTDGLLDWAEKQKTPKNDHVAPGALIVVFNNIVSSGAIQPPGGFQILTTIVADHMTIELRGLPEGQAKWFYLKNDEWFVKDMIEEYLLVFPDLFFETTNEHLTLQGIDWWG